MSSSEFVKSIIGDKKVVKPENKYVSKNEEWRFSVARVMLTGILKNQYYRSADQAAKEALSTILYAAKTDSEYLLKAAAFAREANMKGMVKLAVAALASVSNDDFLNAYRVEIINLLSTFHPGQLLQFVELMKSKALGRGFGRRPQRWVQAVMEGWNSKQLEDYTLKYPTALNALVRLVHPNLNDANGKLVCYILSGKDKKYGKPTGKKQKAVEKMKSLKDDNAIAKLMLDNEVPWDVVKGFHPIKGDVGLAMMTQMGLSALLLNVRSLEQNGILTDKKAMTAFEMKLNEVKGGRSLPIDFAKPYIHCSNLHVKNLLVKAIVDSLANNMPAIEGRKIGVSVDISGSMNGEPLVTAGLLSVPFLKAKDLWFTTFDTSLYEEGTGVTSYRSFYSSPSGLCPKLKGCSPEKQVKNLLSLTTNGGTNIALSLTEAIVQRRKLDLHVIITDEQQNQGTPLMKVWTKYKKDINPRAELWVINATNSEWHAADFNDPSVTVYQTMTPAIFKNLQFVGQDLVSAVKDYDLNKIKSTNAGNYS
jgi:hypothetical protein